MLMQRLVLLNVLSYLSIIDWILQTLTMVYMSQLMYEEASQVANDAVGSIRTVSSFFAEKKVMDL